MHRSAWRSTPPNWGRHGTDQEFRPNSGHGNDESLVGSAFDETFRRVRVEGRGEIDEQESHRRNTPTVVFTSVSVTELVRAKHCNSQYVENEKISPGLIRKIEELQGVLSDFRPVGDGDGCSVGQGNN